MQLQEQASEVRATRPP